MLVYRSGWLRLAEVWFDEPVDGLNVDVVRYHQAPCPIPGAVCTPFYTLLLDLRPAEDELWNKVRKEVRYEVRRAQKADELTCGEWDRLSPFVLERFVAFYNAFALQRGLAPQDVPRLHRLAAAGALDISWVERGAEPLVYHAHLVTARRPRLLHSASLFRDRSESAFRSLVGRSNRFLHWRDILRFKAAGMVAYDFGGWYEGKDDAERLQINKFKEGFGGTVVKGWDAEELVSPLALLTLPLARRVRRMAGSWKKKT